MLWQRIARPLLFLLPAERAHYFSMGMFKAIFALGLGGLFRWRNRVNEPCLKTKVVGIDFQNPVGLAAGFDKDARWFPQLASLGFSHVEIGTITGEAQPGNPQPRLFRLPADQAIVNRMGFNNSGSDAVARRLAVTPKANAADILGINIGKTKVVPVEDATQDYLVSFEKLFTYADYFTVNVSSPNTPGLRTLQNREPLIDLLSKLITLNRDLAIDHECSPKPILLKIAPDVTEDQLSDISRSVKAGGKHLELTQYKYQSGLVSHRDVLDSLNELNSLKTKQSQIQFSELTSITQLYKTLGGGWAQTVKN